MMRDMFKTNRVYDTSALSSFRIDSNVYGDNLQELDNYIAQRIFNTDVIRAVTPRQLSIKSRPRRYFIQISN